MHIREIRNNEHHADPSIGSGSMMSHFEKGSSQVVVSEES